MVLVIAHSNIRNPIGLEPIESNRERQEASSAACQPTANPQLGARNRKREGVICALRACARVGYGSLFEVVLMFEGCDFVMPLFRHVYPLGGMCSLGWDEEHERQRMRRG